ncbi:unnamed protein product [Ilex paraguariensis]|uniref:Uncharacterized protein n=1 Tax=Ilex paraguariensis TaxID=185542 RepID=A0ABC8REI8_9AQUA
MYVSLGGDRVNLDIYYRVPGYSLDMGVKQMRSHCDIIELLKCYENLPVVVIDIDKGDDLLSVLSPDCARHTMNTMDDEVDINVNEQIQNSDTLETDSNDNDYIVNISECYDSDEYSENPSWIYEDLEGLDDDGIFKSDFLSNRAETSVNHDVGPSQSNRSTNGAAYTDGATSNTAEASTDGLASITGATYNAATPSTAVASNVVAASTTGRGSRTGAIGRCYRSGAVGRGFGSGVVGTW